MAIGTAAAIIGGSLIAGGLGARSASKASKAQRAGQEASIGEQRRQFDITQANLQPFQQAGVGALAEQQALLGLSGEEAGAAATARLGNLPGQQFLRDRAQRNLLRSSAAIGGLGGGNVRSALVQQGVGFAQQDLQNRFGRLGQLAGQGQASATSLGQFGAQSAQNIGQSLQAQGQARASGILGQNQALQAGISGAFTGAGQFGLFNQTPQAQVSGFNPGFINQPRTGPF